MKLSNVIIILDKRKTHSYHLVITLKKKMFGSAVKFNH